MKHDCFYLQRLKARRGRRTMANAVLALAIIVVCGGCSSTPAGMQSKVTRTASAPPTLAPVSHALWRVAYLTSDEAVHWVTTDGVANMSGPTLQLPTINGLNFSSAGISPRGHILAYSDPHGISLVDLTTQQQTAVSALQGQCNELHWSPDGDLLAVNEGQGQMATYSTTTSTWKSVPAVSAQKLGSLFGWIDEAHLAVSNLSDVTLHQDPGGDSYATGYSLASLDIASGRIATIAHISSPGLGAAFFSISPDGSQALFYNRPFRNDPFTPITEIIDTHTGAVTLLPSITRSTQGSITSVAWRPTSGQIALSVGFAENGSSQLLLIDPKHDVVAARIADGLYAEQWTPDGSTLIAATSNTAAVGIGPHNVVAITPTSNGNATILTLAVNAMTFPVIGIMATR